MLNIIINLLLINLIVVMVFNSGFIDSIDEMINRKWKFYHLPKPFSCALCMTFWTSVIWLLFTKELTLLTLAMALFSATLTTVTTPLLKLIENWLLKIIEWIMPR